MYPSPWSDTPSPLTPDEVASLAPKIEACPDILMRLETEETERAERRVKISQAISDRINLDIIELYETLPSPSDFIQSLPNTFPHFELEDPSAKTDPDY